MHRDGRSGERLSPESFTRRVLDDLEQAGVVENTFIAYHRAHGLEVSRLRENETLGTLDLFVTDFTQQPLAEKLRRQQTETLFRRLVTFVRRCREGLRRSLDEASDVYDMCTAVEKHATAVPRIRLFILLMWSATATGLPPTDFDGMPVTYEVWDLARLHRHVNVRDAERADHRRFRPAPAHAWVPRTWSASYSVLLAIVPGTVLADLYGRYGTRLLELNVRSFLQTKGAVNRGIRETLLNEPDRFLAYNNGITATASEVDFTNAADGGQAIGRVHDLQIVNGGRPPRRSTTPAQATTRPTSAGSTSR